MFVNEIFNFQVILTNILGKNWPNTIWGWNGQRRGYTSSGESEMNSSLLRYLFVMVFLVTWDSNLPISRVKTEH